VSQSFFMGKWNLPVWQIIAPELEQIRCAFFFFADDCLLNWLETNQPGDRAGFLAVFNFFCLK